MATITDFGVLRRKKKRQRMAKTLLLILLVLCITYGFSKVVNTPDFVGVSSIPELLKGGPGFPIEAPGGKSKGMYQNAGNLMILNETNLYMYNSSGRESFSVQHRMSNPQIVTKGNMTLNYDRGSKSFSAYNRTTPFISTKTDYAIKSGDISASGEIVLATQSDTAQSNVFVLDKHQREKFRLKFTDYIMGVAISKDGNDIAVSSVFTDSGVLSSKITMYHNGKETASKVLDGELILKMSYNNGNDVRCVTDKSAFLCNAEGNFDGKYDYKNQLLAGYSVGEQGGALVFGDFEQDGAYTMIVLNEDFYTVNGSCTLTESLQRVKILNETILVLGSKTLSQYSINDCELLSQTEADYMYDIQPMGNFVYAITNTEVTRVDLEIQSKFAQMTHKNSRKSDDQNKQPEKKTKKDPTPPLAPGLSG